ncbi:hypothetical protein RN001_003955 [Aquatica leii]|uniref:Uncharacterized protein n=1 Tax=Aquatica leii TaxID=1421715 RepID=A0AAN7SMK3_9COLE|nr:hypothetical protein RN001_003955 [Aquatica leii]
MKTFSNDDIDFSQLRAENALEEVFKTECLIYYNKIDDLVNVLKSDNPIIIEKVLKIGSRFIRDGFKNLSGNVLVGELFPRISYNTKLKLLHRFALHLTDVHKADEYYKAIDEAYGTYLAAKMLPSCSEGVIIQCVEENRVEIVPKHMLIILEKYPDIAEDLLDALSGHYNAIAVPEKYICVFTHIAKTNIELCLKLWEKFRPRFCLGIRATRTIIENNRNDLMQNPRKYVNFLKKSEIGKVLKNDFVEFFVKIFPTTIAKVNDTVDVLLLLLKHIKADSDKLSLLLETFRKVYGCDLWDFSVLIRPELLELMTIEERRVFVNLKEKPGHITNEAWISYMDCEKSLPWLMEKIDQERVFSSTILWECLVKTCAINNDLQALFNVFVFVKEKNSMAQSNFLTALVQFFDFSLLEEKHWTCLNEYVDVYKKTGNFSQQSGYIFGQYIRYCLKVKRPIQELLILWFSSPHNAYSRYRICTEDAKCEKRCLEVFNKMEPRNFPENSFINYFNCVIKWNKRYPKDKILVQLTESIFEVIKTTLDDENNVYSILDVAERCIYDYFEQGGYNILCVFFKRKYYFNHLLVSQWLLQHHPQVFFNHIEDITQNLMQCKRMPFRFKNNFKYYAHLNIPQLMKEICLQNGATFWLSLLVDVSEFKRLCYQHKDLLMYLEHVSSVTETLDLIKKYCEYDYLQYIQRPLYLAAYRVNELDLITFFKSLTNSDARIKKHLIFLVFKVLSKQTILTMAGEFLKDRNHLVLKSVFKGFFNLFIRSPDDQLWNLTQHTMGVLNKNDMEVFKILSNCRRIPNRYFGRYVKFAWIALDEVADGREEIVTGKRRILDCLAMSKLLYVPEDFCLEIIQKNTSHPELYKNVMGFICRFVADYPKHAETVFEKLIDLSKSASRFDQKQSILLVKELCKNFIIDSTLPKHTFLEFVNSWDDVIKPQEAYRQHLHLHFALINVNSTDSTIDNLAKNLTSFCNSFEEDIFDVNVLVEIFSLYKDRLYSLFCEFDSEMVNLILIEKMLENSCSNACLLFVIKLIPDCALEGVAKSKYESIIGCLSEKCDPLVSAHFDSHLNSTVDYISELC